MNITVIRKNGSLYLYITDFICKENILSLFEELDKEKSENSVMGFSLRRSLKVRQFVERSKNVIHFQKIKESSHSYANFVMNLFFKFMK